MIKSKLHTFKELLEKGIWHQDENEANKGEYYSIDCIYVPKIQRDYAQGRESEFTVRKEFLDDIFDRLVGNEQLELSFIFGSKQSFGSNNREGFEILDGQQRLTTLFLLQWYLGMRELQQPERMVALTKFTYETRDTSSDFISRLTQKDTTLTLDDRHPSEIIKGRKWFTDEYLCDPTVTAMLGMLDAIHDRYPDSKNRIGEGNLLYTRLDNLKFYILMLEKFEMSDELYIKMNSRGLSLSLFENFKASLVKYLKSRQTTENDRFWFEFTTKMDAEWIDLFWKPNLDANSIPESSIEINDTVIGERYIRFFLRYFFSKAAVNNQNGITEYFYDLDNGNLPKRLMDWNEQYVPFFDSEVDLFVKLKTVFDAFHKDLKYYLDEIRNDPFGNLTKFLDNFENSNTENYSFTLQHRAAFGSLTEFIEHIPAGKSIEDKDISENYKRYCRILFNVIENTLIEGTESVVSVIKAMGEIAALPEAHTANIYVCLANSTIDSKNSQLQEEILKAKQMCPNKKFDPSWETAFKKAELHPFFKGSIGFFFEPSILEAKDFESRFDVMKDLFDANGIAPDMRKEHLLIRAIFSCLNTWNLLKGQRITEKAETEKFLKNMITGKSEVHDMFCSFFNQSTFKEIEGYLKDFIKNSKPDENESIETGWLFTRLTSDADAPCLYDWINEKEGNGKKEIFRVNPKYYYINKPNKQFNYLLFNSERRLLIPELVNQLALDDTDANKVWNSSIQDYTEKQITLYKSLKDSAGDEFKLKIIFNELLEVKFFLPIELKDKLLEKGKITVQQLKSDHIEMQPVLKYKFNNPDEIRIISDEVNRLESLVNTL